MTDFCIVFISIARPVTKATKNVENTETVSLGQDQETVKDKIDGIENSEVASKPPKSEFKERDDRVSNLQLENRLLKGEIASLNEELANSMRRLKELEEGL